MPQPQTEPVAPSLEELVAALGGESRTERNVKRVVPWIVSVAVHLGLVALGFLVTWTVVQLNEDDRPTLIVADFSSMTYAPLVSMPHERAEADQDLVQDRLDVETWEDRIDEDLESVVDPLTLLADAGSGELARFAPDPTRTTATFVGISTTNARRIVYVIDASGSMIRSLPIVIEELARSLDGLVAQQKFSVIFFSRNEAIIVPPVRGLSSGTNEEKRRVLAWIAENVIPSGRSNPMAALEKALGLDPDVIFLLSENITGSGEFEIDQADLLMLLDELNPADPRTGHRATQINCIQFLDPDPLHTLEEIAREHGGEQGYKFLDREELGLTRP